MKKMPEAERAAGRRQFGMKSILLTLLGLGIPAAHAQWQIVSAPTTADLEGVDNVGEGVAWASGSGGAILHTEDGGHVWKLCTAPADGAQLDFRGIQGFSKTTAVVMSAGKGESSRVYKTTDSCQTWKKVFGNPDGAGSFAALHRASAFQMYLLGDPVNGKFAMYESADAGNTWSRSDDAGLAAPKGSGIFIGGSASLTNVITVIAFGTGGPGSSVYTYLPVCKGDKCSLGWVAKTAPLAQTGAKVGVFSVAGRNLMVQSRAVVTGIGTEPATALVAVGGDSEKPTQSSGTAAFSTDDGASWKAAVTPPNGFRSAVDFDAQGGRFIAVGPNGTDETVDDGLLWYALKPGPSDDPQADQHWTALSVPFAVGPHGRIGILHPESSKEPIDGNHR